MRARVSPRPGPRAPSPAGDHTGDLGWSRAESRGARGGRVCARTAGTRTRTPLPRPRPARPHARRTGRRPHSPRSLCRPWSEAAAGRSAARQRPGWKIPGRQEGAGQPVPGSAPPPPRIGAAAPRPGPRQRRTAPAAAGRGPKEPRGSPAPERGGPAGPVCACVRAAQPAAGQGSGASGPGGRLQGPHGCCPACVCVHVRAHAGWVYVREREVRVRVHRCVRCRMGCVRLAGGVLVFVQRACVQARSLRTPRGGWGAALACAGAWTPKVRLQPQGGAQAVPGSGGGRWETGACGGVRRRPTLPAPHLPPWSENTTTPQGQEEGARGAGAGSVSGGELMRVGGDPRRAGVAVVTARKRKHGERRR